MTPRHGWDRWFRRIKGQFEPWVRPYSSQPIVYVEIGCWAGASAEFMAREILTHPGSIGVGIDPYFAEPPRHPKEEIDEIQAWAHARVRAACGDRWTWVQQPSNAALRRINRVIGRRKIDILYIDGDHDAHAVVQDFALAWPHLRVGSTVIFDDYLRVKTSHHPHVREGYHAILSAWGGLIEERTYVAKNPKQRAVIVTKLSHR